jgi:CheY-like chemotaxis protein
VVTGDPARLRQVLVNLVGNAIKFTERGEVRVELGLRAAADGTPRLWFGVRDTGIGIPKESQARIFARFTQGDRSTTRRFGGTGLGLAISKQLVELMGGEIGVESAAGRGSLFWFTLPCRPAGPAAATEPPAESPAPQPARPLRILVAEDNAVNQMLVRQLLANCGHSVEVAATGAEAVAALERSDYDLVLMDIYMPEMDGVAATRKIRSMKSAAANIPIVALTASAMAGDRERYLAAGMTDYVPKPVDSRALLAAIARALGLGRGGAAGSLA